MFVPLTQSLDDVRDVDGDEGVLVLGLKIWIPVTVWAARRVGALLNVSVISEKVALRFLMSKALAVLTAFT